jgi:hypothetical protein
VRDTFPRTPSTVLDSSFFRPSCVNMCIDLAGNLKLVGRGQARWQMELRRGGSHGTSSCTNDVNESKANPNIRYFFPKHDISSSHLYANNPDNWV